MANFCDKNILTGCKWSSLNAPSTENPVSHSLLSESLFSFSASLSGVIRNWTPHNKDQEGGNILEQNQLKRQQMAQFECPKYRNPCVSFTFGRVYPPPSYKPTVHASGAPVFCARFCRAADGRKEEPAAAAIA